MESLSSPGVASTRNWENRRVGITGVGGSLGCSLSKKLRSQGALVIGLSHKSIKNKDNSANSPNEWVQWKCGQEEKLDGIFKTLDVLILNHGINPGGSISSSALHEALEVNALSTWRLMERFEKIAENSPNPESKKELWVNTSEAEIQPALSPSYEISKRLIGQIVSLKWHSAKPKERSNLKIRKLILGPFRSKLNPLGIMNSDFVANQILNQARLNLNLIIVTPNPITYFLCPLNELIRTIYISLTKK
ncbi:MULTISPECIES: SDR family oxidoreductase [Prochlorococcus]|uniref:SDR family oxidoreductase n=1 Tax=Prochlorococcus TaxID=1218 RepID=UPI00053390E3|nr:MULTISPECIES: SDR family oxidoreductase [Prochlorococcus]KGG12915.1 hypothetical protein EV05_0588 [Prochlorococcus sp. MIT 0601]